MSDAEIKYLIRVLRAGTIGSAPRNLCLKKASKKVFVRYAKNGNKVFKTHWQCAACKEWFRDSESLEVDHIDEIGPFKGDWHDFIVRMYFCGQKNLRALCVVCHARKTSGYNSRLLFERKK